jgi:hypothetical protein
VIAAGQQTATSFRTAATFVTAFDTDADCSRSSECCALLLDLVLEVIVMIVVPTKYCLVDWKRK